LRGLYKPISNRYSVALQKLISDLLTRDPKKRPDLHHILANPWLREEADKMKSKYRAMSEMEAFSFKSESPSPGGNNITLTLA